MHRSIYKCKLKAVKSTALRTTEINGECAKLPEKGKRFYMFAEALEKGAFARFVNTSEIVDLRKDGDTYILGTESGSIYHVTILEEMKGE